jgi:hypothetical protein
MAGMLIPLSNPLLPGFTRQYSSRAPGKARQKEERERRVHADPAMNGGAREGELQKHPALPLQLLTSVADSQ